MWAQGVPRTNPIRKTDSWTCRPIASRTRIRSIGQAVLPDGDRRLNLEQDQAWIWIRKFHRGEREREELRRDGGISPGDVTCPADHDQTIPALPSAVENTWLRNATLQNGPVVHMVSKLRQA